MREKRRSLSSLPEPAPEVRNRDSNALTLSLVVELASYVEINRTNRVVSTFFLAAGWRGQVLRSLPRYIAA